MKTRNQVVGRKQELATLTALLKSKRAEFVALYGRRRIGKTFLIRNFFAGQSCTFLHATGIQKGSTKEQLAKFANQLGSTFYEGAPLAPKTCWLDEFEDLNDAINKSHTSKKIIIFLDELPWMATKKSDLLKALEYFWNRYWSHDPRIKLIACGSCASWIIEKIINSRGGLHNRATRIIKLLPFSLDDTKAFLHSFQIRLKDKQILDLYMVLGGIPHYLALVKKSLSAQQNIEELFFQKTGALSREFDNLFASLFKESEIYISLVRQIAKYRYGISQTELFKKLKNTRSGRTSLRLKHLEDSGFILSFIPYQKEKGLYYKVIDEYTLFYLCFIEPLQARHKTDLPHGYWLSCAKTASFKTWAGYAFEAVCFKHLSQIRKTLKIDPGATAGSWKYTSKKNEKGAQIDLLFDRPDEAITLCEIKYSDKPFLIDKEYAENLKTKIKVYQEKTKTKKDLFVTMITVAGVKESKYSTELIAQETTLEDLFG